MGECVFSNKQTQDELFLFPVLHDLAETQSFVCIMVLASATNPEILVADFVSQWQAS
jgi:hypothetical protein